nr:MAG TPA: hypothetical protein [Bacteriophage sp.]
MALALLFSAHLAHNTTEHANTSAHERKTAASKSLVNQYIRGETRVFGGELPLNHHYATVCQYSSI